MSSKLLVNVENHVQIITLNNPPKKNAFDREMIGAWVAALEDAQRNDDVHVVVVTGSGNVFCSGGDVSQMKAGKPTPLDAKNALWENIHHVPLTLRRMDKPVIAAINGPAVGAGLDMALMCDMRTMASTARVSEGYVKVGLIPGDGGAYFLPRLVGLAKAYELLWTGNFIDAEEALRLGLVNHVYPAETLMEETLKLAYQIASGPQIAIRMTKRAVRQSLEMNLDASLDMISSHMAVIKETEDHAEGVSAFLEKRKPQFKGR
jgi:2-(1,2-epoxy-1,2-dihydrophenyl)acetyl-CoA isomerase